MILLLYDDLFLMGENELITYAKRRISTELIEIKELGMIHYFLGMEVWQSVDGIFLRQGK